MGNRPQTYLGVPRSSRRDRGSFAGVSNDNDTENYIIIACACRRRLIVVYEMKYRFSAQDKLKRRSLIKSYRNNKTATAGNQGRYGYHCCYQERCLKRWTKQSEKKRICELTSKCVVRNRYPVSYASMASSNRDLSVVILRMHISSGVTCTVWFVYVWRYMLDGPHTWDSDISR